MRPPAGKRFAKGRSGNPKGRPTGTPNVADILATLFNKKITVREGYETRLMSACEAIIRHAVAKARSGDGRVLTTVLDILDKLGVTKDVTAQEREKRTLKLPRPYTLDEYDLIHTPSREKERQYYRALIERQETVAVDGASVPSAIRDGDEFQRQGHPDRALVAFRRQITDCHNELTKNANSGVAQNDLKRVVARIGLLAEQHLLAANFATALACADEALSHSEVTDLTWIALIRAHANMFLNRTDEARKFYLGFRTAENLVATSWESYILRNFGELRKVGHSHPLMVEIEKKLFDAGWIAQGRRTTKIGPTVAINHADRQFMLMNPEHVQTAALLAEQGKLDEAAEVYRRILTKCRARLANDPTNAETRQMLDLVILRFGGLAEQFAYGGRFPTALECAEELLAVDPANYGLQAIKAHALMFIGQSDAAQAIYLRYRGQKVRNVSWETAVLADFEKFRQKCRLNPLMEKVVTLFAKNVSTPPPKDPPTPTNVQLDTNPTAIKAIEYSDVGSGDRLVQEGEFEEALKVYLRCISTCQARLANGRMNLQAVDDYYLAISRISDLAFILTIGGHFQRAFEIAEDAIKLQPNLPSPNLRRAHALMFLEKPDEARGLYQRYRAGKATPERTWPDVIRGDFAIMRESGHSHPLMDEIEDQLCG
jgi:tetratricopeptide (TPR) repeat protein